MFELLEKMYIEVQDMKSNMATKDDIAKIEQKLIVMEDKMDINHKALYDGYKLNYKKLENLEEKVNKIEKNVEKQDVEIRVIKSVR